MPKVSIVLPTYNGQEYIRESIDSIIKQTYEDWELIIVNDCSTDETLTIIREYQKLDERIYVINNKENKKLPASLNIGFEYAQGQYYTWTSDDNMYLPDAIEKMVRYLENNKNEYMVCTQMNFISEKGEFVRLNTPYSNEYLLIGDCVGACFLYRCEVVKSVGEYDLDYFLVEDYEYWLRVLFKYGNIAYIDEALYNYRIHENSLTATKRKGVLYNNSRMRTRYIHELVEGLNERKNWLCQLYFEIECFYGITNDVYELLYKYVEEFLCKISTELEENVIVYGAGNIGRKFLENNKTNIAFFSDQDKRKIGTYIEDILVISLDDMASLSNKYQIVVAAGSDKVYDFLNTLKSLGIENYYIDKSAW